MQLDAPAVVQPVGITGGVGRNTGVAGDNLEHANDPNARTEAAEILRGLIDRIAVRSDPMGTWSS